MTDRKQDMAAEGEDRKFDTGVPDSGSADESSGGGYGNHAEEPEKPAAD